MLRWHPQPAHRVALEIEFDHDGWFAPDHPAIVPWLDRNCPRGGKLENASVGILNMDLASREKPHVRVLT